MDDEPLSSGEFSRRTRLSRKALRVYERTGLLCPADVNPDSGYRRYAIGQVRAGQIIAALRGAGLGLAEIGPVIADLDTDRAGALARLEQAIAGSQRRHEDRVLVIRHVQTSLAEGDDPMFEIQTRRVPARRFMSMQRRLHAPQTDAFVTEAKAAFADRLGDRPPAGPFMLLFHGVVSGDSDGPLEATLGCPDEIVDDDVIGIRTEPAHDEAYTRITRAQWAYPVILAAYDAVACSPAVRARPGSALCCREVYLAEPETVDDDESLCDIAYPLGDSARP